MLRMVAIVVVTLVRLCDVAWADSPGVGIGHIESLRAGVLYLYGGQYKIAIVDTGGARAEVAVPASDPLSSPVPGEEISFSGPEISIGGVTVVDTTKGFLWRKDGKDTAESMAVMEKDAEAQAAAAAAQGIPNAVQTMTVLTPAQEAEQARSEAAGQRDRLLNYTLGLLSLIVGVLAFERAQRLISAPIDWVRRYRLRRKSEIDESVVPREPATRGEVTKSEARGA